MLIVVEDLEDAMRYFTELMGAPFIGPLELPKHGLRTCFNTLGIELVQATEEKSSFAKYVLEKGPGLFAVALKVPNVDEAVQELAAKGVTPIGRGRPEGFNAALIAAEDTRGCALEIVQHKTIPDTLFCHEFLDHQLPWFKG